MPTSAVLALIEAAAARLLDLDPRVRPCLLGLAGRVVALRAPGLPAPLYLTFLDGIPRLAATVAHPPNVTVTGPASVLLRLALGRDGSGLLASGEVRVEGEVAVLQTLHRCLTAARVDWEEWLARALGDLPAHELARQVRAARGWVGDSAGTLAADLREYLWEEARLVPRRETLDELFDAVDRLRDDAARLAKRVERLARRSSGGAGG